MKIFRHYQQLPDEARGAVVAIGNFDGVHIGHRAVINEAGRIARDIGAPWAVLSFEPHPRSLFGTEAAPFRLTPFKSKARQVEKMGADIMLVLNFDDKFSKIPAHDFVNSVLVNGLSAHHVVSGHDFVFGYKRQGNCDFLLHEAGKEGFDYTCVHQVLDSTGEAYSSTRVRKLLKDGNMAAAAQVLGRHFEIEGRVEHGEKRGVKIGFPTVNLHLGETLCPRKGIYAVRVGIENNGNTTWYNAAADLGHRPTFGGKGVVLEAHILDLDEDLYGRHIRVKMVDYLRNEKKFENINDLKIQIANDCQQARQILTTPKERL